MEKVGLHVTDKRLFIFCILTHVDISLESMLCFFVLLTTLLNSILHKIEFTHFKCTIQLFSVSLQSGATVTRNQSHSVLISPIVLLIPVVSPSLKKPLTHSLSL